MQEKKDTPVAHILFRGDYDKRRDAVKPMTPAFLPPMADNLPHNRFGFAKWLLRPDNPLTARVTVNRFWQEVFGTGIVRTTGDFGISGELPSHPELLDWLAVEFRESGWDMKEFFKLVVMSATYRQAATSRRKSCSRTASNRLLSRGPRFRMDGEMVRDYALAASGLLVDKLGGPSVKPYQPDGVWEAVAMNVQQHPHLSARPRRTAFTAAACTPSGNVLRRRPAWRSSMPPVARPARFAANEPTRPCRPS